jgi:hypothetical protein
LRKKSKTNYRQEWYNHTAVVDRIIIDNDRDIVVPLNNDNFVGEYLLNFLINRHVVVAGVKSQYVVMKVVLGHVLNMDHLENMI